MGVFQNHFTESFVAGAYRDSRLGVAEMRKRRVDRLRARQYIINQAQEKVKGARACVRAQG
jgi:hypothetical protein